MYKRITAVILTILLIATGFTGCGSGAAVLFGQGDDKEKEYKVSNEVDIPMEKIRTLNPLMSKDKDTYHISKLLYNGIFELDETLAPKPVLAANYSFSEDKLSLNISLKRDIKWNDGKPLTASDVKFTIDSLISLAATGDTIYGEYISNIKYVKIEKGNAQNCTIYFKNSGNVALENLIFPILPAHQYKSFSMMKASYKKFIPIGTGPYKVDKYNELSSLILKGNEYYYDQVPQNILRFVVLPQKNDGINLLEVNNVSLFFAESMDRKALISNKDATSHNYLSNEAEFIGFNCKNPVLKDRRIRQAIAYSVDSRDILETAYFKGGIMSDSIYYPGYLDVENKGDLYAYNLEAALKLINQAGFINRDEDYYVEDPDGNEISIRILVNNDNQFRVTSAQLIKNALDKLPIQSYIIYCDWQEYNRALSSGDYDIYLGGYKFDERYDLRRLLHSDYNNVTGYSNKKVDLLLDKMQAGVSNMEKAQAYGEVKEILSKDLPYYCMFYKTYGAVASPSLQGEIKPVFNYIYRGCQDWSNKYEIFAAVAE